MGNDLIFKIEEFEGPLDLILEMFKKQEMEITSINLEPILDQYVKYIKTLEEQNYNVAVEYIDLAAEIVLYKSNKVLDLEETIEDDQEPIFDKEDLIDKLLEYKRYKEVSKKIKELEETRNQFLIKEVSDLNLFKENKLEKLELEKFKQIIAKTFSEIELKKKKEKTKSLTKKDYNIKDYINELEQLSEINFSEIIQNKEKKEVIIIFLSILEILKYQSHKLLVLDDNIIIIKES